MKKLYFMVRKIPKKDQINSMCFFNQNIFTGKKYIQNMIAQMEEAPYKKGSKGAGVTFLDATPNIVIEASFSYGVLSVLHIS